MGVTGHPTVPIIALDPVASGCYLRHLYRSAPMRRVLTALLLSALLAPASALAQGGPDSFGYEWDVATYDWVDLSSGPGSLISGLNTDDAEATVSLPFTFSYYGNAYTSVRVADNGGLSFNTSASISYTNACYPTSTSSSYPDLAVYWDDLVSSNKVYSYNDTAGGRFIISWEDVAHFSGAGAASFQVHLYPSGLIEYHYADVYFGSSSYNNGASATVGIQDQTGGTQAAGNALSVICNSSTVLSSGYAVAFESCVDADLDGYPDLACGGDDCDDSDPAIFPGAVEVCGDGVDDDCDGADQSGDGDSDGYTGVDCGGDDCDDSDPTLHPGVDADGDGSDACSDCDDSDPTLHPGIDADSDGSSVCDDCDDSDPSTYPGAPELCDALDNDCDGAPGSATPYTSPAENTTSTATGYFRGGKFQATTDTVISALAIDLTAAAGGTIDFGVYEASSETGSYSLIASSTITPASAARQWHESDPLGVPVTAGNWYVLGATWSASNTFYFLSSSSASFPYPTSWGTHEGGGSANTFSGVLPASHSFSTSGTSYNIRVITSGADESDSDGDGQAACAGDCDDSDPTTYLGATELCDGLDNDCDSVVPSTEVDADFDGFYGCAGDCDDYDSTVYPGATELCDGQDNDCDGLGDGADADSDGYLACEDCDDNNYDTNPGAVEICDGEDNDCDGFVGTIGAETFEYNTSSSSFSGGNRFRGDYFYTYTATTVTGIEARLDPPYGGATFNWVVYEASSSSGTYTRIHSSTTSTSSSTSNWYASGAISVPLQAGKYYTIGAWWSSSYTVSYWNGSMSSTNPSWGDHLGGMTHDGTISTSQTFGTSTNGYPIRVDSAVGGVDEQDADGDGYVACEECDDSDPTVFPGGVELCNGLDDDCDLLVPADEQDADFDGWWPCEGDCDDADPGANPGEYEICDQIDNDCDGSVPPDEYDDDSDGYAGCEGDCDDADPLSHPYAAEQCDGVDNDCNGIVPSNEADIDGDGYRICESDCDDGDASVNPGATESCDGQDNDCDGVVPADEADDDFDGYRLCDGDCDDGDASVNPGASEVCDGQDNDCDGSPDFDAAGEADLDGDGWLSCEECDDSNAATNPAAVEICDQQDNDCDGIIPTDEADDDSDGMAPCQGDCDDDDPDTYDGAPEICDEVDNDCDGTTEDENEDVDEDGVSPCDGDCDDTNAETYPGADEVCDGQDNSCDEQLPDDEADADADGWMECEGDCDDEEPSASPDGTEDDEEACNDDLDNDCDGDWDGQDEDCEGLTTGDDDDEEGGGSRRRGTCSVEPGRDAAPVPFLALALLWIGLRLGARRRRIS